MRGGEKELNMKRKIRTVLDFLNIDGYAAITPEAAIDFINWLDEEDLDEDVKEYDYKSKAVQGGESTTGVGRHGT